VVAAVIVGSSIGGVRTAQALRREGYAGPVTIIGELADVPYDKPPLSKDLLSGASEPRRSVLLDRAQAAAIDVELRLGRRAEHVDLANHHVLLDDGDQVEFDHLVIATGAHARPAPWAAAGELHVLRTLEHCRSLQQQLRSCSGLTVIGAGFIGAEVAATARALGLEVTLVDPLTVPMARALGPELGPHFVDLHERHGTRTVFGVGVEDVVESDGGLQVLLADGSRLAAQAVLVGIGAIPNDAWLAASGLEIDNGVVCDQYCRTTRDRSVFAVGDVARWWHPGHGEYVRVEHWTNAVEQAMCVAHNICHPGELVPYNPVEYVWSDQYDWKIQIAGRPAGGRTAAVLGGTGQGRFAALYEDERGRLTGAVTVNASRSMATCRRLLRDGSSADAALDQLAAREDFSRPARSVGAGG
jgi:phthalate 3,4-dioxygenase ferredoxin reductase subunit